MKRVVNINSIDVRRNIERFMQGDEPSQSRPPDDNYASFDYCFNYFQSFRNQGRISKICHPENLQQSCLQISFYLASWGMLRGSSFLLGKSARFYRGFLKTIVELDENVWEIDVDCYTDENIGRLLDTASRIRRSLSTTKWASDTLVTKIMLAPTRRNRAKPHAAWSYE